MPIYTFPTSEPNFIESHDLVLEANRPRVLDAYGRTFTFITGGAPLQMAFNNGRYFDIAPGTGWILQEEERYNTLKFLSPVAQTIRVFTGNFIYQQSKIALQNSRTKLVPYNQTSINAGTSVEFNTIPSGCAYRKSIIVTNNDPSVDLEIEADDGGTWRSCAIVFSKQAWYLETSDKLRVKNGSGGAVNFRVVETFYLNE